MSDRLKFVINFGYKNHHFAVFIFNLEMNIITIYDGLLSAVETWSEHIEYMSRRLTGQTLLQSEIKVLVANKMVNG